LGEIGASHDDLPWGELTRHSLRELGVTSLRLFELVSAIEELGGFVFDDDDVEASRFEAPAALADMIDGYLARRDA